MACSAGCEQAAHVFTLPFDAKGLVACLNTGQWTSTDMARRLVISRAGRGRQAMSFRE